MSVISDAQRRVLALLAPHLPGDAYLAGGVAVAARANHRASHDLDIFTVTTDPEVVLDALAALRDVRVTGRAPGTVYLEVEGIPVSMLLHPYRQIVAPTAAPGIALGVASLPDLTAMKLHAIASRGAARDFWDLHTLLTLRGISLSEALAEHSQRYPSEDAGHVVRSLAYFGDAEQAPLPAGLAHEQWEAIRSDIERRVREI